MNINLLGSAPQPKLAAAPLRSSPPSLSTQVRAGPASGVAPGPATHGQAPPLVHAAIKLIVSDVDGTLLNSQQKLTSRVEAAVKQAAAAGVPLVVATGKARGPWVKTVFPRLQLKTPGVFLQGLMVYDGEGRVLYEQHLEHELVLDIIRLADEQGVTLTAYCGERVLADCIDAHTERLAFYGEPDVEAVGAGRLGTALLEGGIKVHKLLFMAEQERIDTLRPVAEQLLSGRAVITTAIKGMLEVLPLGASKGAGVAWLLRHMGVDASTVMALGDGENDIEMLQLVGLGVAMGNAGPKLKAVADAVVARNDEDGVAEAIHGFVLKPQALGGRS